MPPFFIDFSINHLNQLQLHSHTFTMSQDISCRQGVQLWQHRKPWIWHLTHSSKQTQLLPAHWLGDLHWATRGDRWPQQCHKFRWFETTTVTHTQPVRKRALQLRVNFSSLAFGTCHGSHRTSWQDSVGHTRATIWGAPLDLDIQQLQHSNSPWHGRNTAPSAIPSPVQSRDAATLLASEPVTPSGV